MRIGNWSKTGSLAVALVALLPRALHADPPTAQIPRVARPPTLDEFLNGAERQDHLRVTGFVQREPGDGVPATQPTTAYLSYDDDNLYVVFICRDEPGKVRAHLSRREAIWGDDLVGVLLDTFRDRRRAYLFIVNPLGIQMDAVTGAGDDDYTFDTLWHSEGRLTPDGYVARIAIPFRSLRFADAPSQTWGIALARAITRNNELSFWPYVTRRIASFGEQLATLEGLQRISPGRNLQFIPYSTLATARFLEEDGGRRATDTTGRAGLDAKLVLRDAVTVDLTVNPDFSQVESDEPQVTINQRFEVFFPEKRPFFIENAGFFETRHNLFFSRRVADPQIGARVTGKAGRWAFAGVAIDDRAAGARRPPDDPRRDQRAIAGVARLQREVASQSTLGALVTTRQFGGSSNRVASADARLKVRGNWYVMGQATASRSTDADGSDLNGSAYYGQVLHEGRRFVYSGRYLDFSPEFSADLGFVPRTDIRQVENYTRYRWRPERRAVVSFGPESEARATWDHAGRLQDWEAGSEFSLEFRGQTEIGGGRTETYELFQGLDFRQHRTYVYFSTEWLAWLALRGSYRLGTGVNFYPAAGLDPFPADFRSARLSATIRPSSRLRFEQTYLYTHLDTRTGAVPRGVASGGIFDNHIVRSRVNYQFTRPLSLRAIIDYHAVLPNSALVALERTKRLKADVLLTYLANPWTAVYVGYTDGYENLIVDDPARAPIRRGGPTFSTGRQFFVKLSYLLRY